MRENDSFKVQLVDIDEEINIHRGAAQIH